ncbi:MAG: PqqD family peptide modification chaperone [bacterium]|nr:MAG: PqqD family peptide modification chaperone [bacterium]
MAVLTRAPSVQWRVEEHREEKALEVLADPDRLGEDPDVMELGTVTILAGGVMHQLNLLGGRIWTLCDGTRDRAAVLDELLGVFEVDRQTLSRDLDEFLADMIGKGLIREEE